MFAEGTRVKIVSGDRAGRVGTLEHDRHPMRTTDYLVLMDELSPEGEKYQIRVNVEPENIEPVIVLEVTIADMADVLENLALATAGRGHTHHDGIGCEGHEDAFKELAREVIERLQ